MSRRRETKKSRRSFGAIGLNPIVPIALLTILLVLPALAPGLLAPADPLGINLMTPFRPPVFLGGDWSHILGTDSLGRDILSRVIYGARATATIAASVVVLSLVIGTALGILAGYVGGLIDAIVMRTADAFFGLPLVLVALALVTLVGPSVPMAIAVMVMSLWPQYAILARGETLSLKNRGFVQYARATGVSPIVVMWRHIRLNLQNAIIVMATLHVGWAILVEAGLSFIGAGVPPPQPAWGSMVADGRIVMVQAPWVSVVPGLAIMLVILSVNLLGDWLRDRIDPDLHDIDATFVTGGKDGISI